ncbi:Gfo/Idh/MocA family protein [Jannaschia sp. CCS1]|uniref:Gfo/Idh/MocA family protein n=1 Tax=Jannaschia sp. (strain CCS1) TaxID=290400 RepID=UPI000053CDB3|nr:Gfo/Idh/MocA family oxidoreductase [Jannaschia sp. CCS1]ABD55979.1 oxidoreductase-like protein [Jannaschia sp. CCS1]
MKTMNGALIGCGFFAENHMHAWAGLEGARIVALCDRDVDKAQAMAKKFGIDQVFSDADDLFAEVSLDFVDVATTAASHRPLVETAVRHAPTVICQKPFAETLEDARAMVAAAQTAGTQLIVHENFRWQRPFVKIKDLITAGQIGAPHWARFSFRHGYDNYVNQPYLAEIERFTIMDVGLHLFDLARHIMGEVTDLSCTTQRLNQVVRGEDAFTALLAHDSGATSVCDCSFWTKLDPDPFPRTLAQIEGAKGTIMLDADFRLTLHTDGAHTITAAEPEVPPWGARPWHGVQDSVIRFQAHALRVMRGEDTPQPSGADNLRTLALALAAYDAAEDRRTIAMEGQA